MTDKEKALAYDKALERARNWQKHLYEIGDKGHANELNYIFPELKGDVDDKIRQELIQYLEKNKERIWIYRDNSILDSWIGWLEEQRKQKPSECSEESEDDKIRKELISFLKGYDPYLTRKFIAWLEKRIYTKKELQDMGFAFTTNGDIVTPKEQEKDLKAYLEHEKEKGLEKQGEQKPADIPIDFEQYVENILNLADGEGHGSPAKTKKVAAELLQLAHKQKPAEWSKEDKEILRRIITHIESLESFAIVEKDAEMLNNEITWLKSLRPQNYRNWTKYDEKRYKSCLQRLGTGNPEQPETVNSKWFKEHVNRWKPRRTKYC